MQLIEELEDKYNQYTGKNFSFLSDRGILKTEISSLMLLYDTVYYNVDDTIKFFLGSDYLNKPELLEVLKNPLKEFFGFYTQICFDIRYKEFIKIAANIYFQCYKDSKDVAENEKPELPKCEMEGSAFVDLISGFNFSHFYPTLDKKTEYYLVDKSIMTCELLELRKQEYELDNVHILCKDIDDLKISDIKQPVEILRIKNPFRYIPDFKDKIEDFKNMICTGGKFIFQEQSIVKTFCYPEYKNIDSYFEGWLKEQQILLTDNPNSLDTLSYKKI